MIKIIKNMKQLHPRAVWLFFIRGFISWLIFLGFIAYLTSGWTLPKIAKTADPWGTILEIIGIIILFDIIWSYIWARLYYHFYKYELTEKEFRKEYGVITKYYTTIPYDRIQNIDIHRGFWGRILGLSELYIQTAGEGGTSVAEGIVPGLSKEDAEKLREELINKINFLKDQGM